MLLIAHRGSSGSRPENTLPAFRQAARDGAAMIEFDVRLSADGIPVVFHDRQLNRMTRRRGRVRDLTAAELSQTEVGKRRRPRVAGATIPLLAKLFDALPPALGFDIELKTDGDRRRAGELSRRVAELIATKGRGRRILVSSFDHQVLRRFRRIAPRVPTGALYLSVRDLTRSAASLAGRAGAKAFICSRAQLRLRHLRSAHTEGISVIVYGVKTLRQFRRMQKRGVDGVITDHPARFRNALRTEID